MKRLFALAAIASVCACSKVPSGHVGIKVHLLGTSKGVESEELGVGRYWIGMNEELHLFPTFKQNYRWTASKTEESPTNEGFLFQTKEGLEVGADVGITYFLKKDKIHSIFQKYRRGVDEITDTFLRNHVRDALIDVVSHMPVEKVYGAGKGEILEKVSAKVKDAVAEDGIIIEKIYFLGSFRLPDQVIKAVSAKIEATQRAIQRQNEVAMSKAEAAKQIESSRGVAESNLIKAKADAEAILMRAKAEAKANELITKSINPTLVRYKSIEKWNGALPKVTSDVIPMINVGE